MLEEGGRLRLPSPGALHTYPIQLLRDKHPTRGGWVLRNLTF